MECFNRALFMCVCEWKVGSVVVPVAPDGLFPAIGMHSLGEEVRLDLQAEWGSEEEDSVMMVDSHEDEWARLYDVRVSGTVSGGWPSKTKPNVKPMSFIIIFAFAGLWKM